MFDAGYCAGVLCSLGCIAEWLGSSCVSMVPQISVSAFGWSGFVCLVNRRLDFIAPCAGHYFAQVTF